MPPFCWADQLHNHETSLVRNSRNNQYTFSTPHLRPAFRVLCSPAGPKQLHNHETSLAENSRNNHFFVNTMFEAPPGPAYVVLQARTCKKVVNSVSQTHTPSTLLWTSSQRIFYFTTVFLSCRKMPRAQAEIMGQGGPEPVHC